ncbi:MAG: hypothetical protein ACI8ZN_001430 [Bacteroidia bacterium]|jgi:hypothetical protein
MTNAHVNKASLIGGFIVLFVVLFFRNTSLGLSWLILGLGMVAVQHLSKPNSRKQRLYQLALLVAGFAVFYHGNALAFFCFLAAYLVVAIGYQTSFSNPIFSVVIGWGNVMVSPISGLIRTISKLGTQKDNNISKVMRYVLITVAMLLVFGLLYTNVSPAFYIFLQDLDLGTGLELLFVAALGSFICFNLLYQRFPEYFARFMLQQEQIRDPEKVLKENSESDDSLYQSRSEWIKPLSFGIFMVSVLLGIVIGTDLIELFSHQVEDFNHSNRLHNSVFALIVSVILAAMLGLWSIRSLNSKPIKVLKSANYLFLSLNIMYVVVNVLNNLDYIQAYGLSARRIGVFFYLSACIVGLGFTLHNVNKELGIRTLFTQVSHALFIMFIAAGLIGWTRIITKYNLSHPPMAKHGIIDYGYLHSLQGNSDLLYDHRMDMNEAQLERLEQKVEKAMRYEVLDIRKLCLSKEIEKRRLKALDIKDNANERVNESSTQHYENQ